MSVLTIETYQAMLQETENRLLRSITQHADNVASLKVKGDAADRAFAAVEKERELRSMRMEQKQLEAVQAILHWLEDHADQFGKCAICGADILERLEVYPLTIYCCEHAGNGIPQPQGER